MFKKFIGGISAAAAIAGGLFFGLSSSPGNAESPGFSVLLGVDPPAGFIEYSGGGSTPTLDLKSVVIAADLGHNLRPGYSVDDYDEVIFKDNRNFCLRYNAPENSYEDAGSILLHSDSNIYDGVNGYPVGVFFNVPKLFEQATITAAQLHLQVSWAYGNFTDGDTLFFYGATGKGFNDWLNTNLTSFDYASITNGGGTGYEGKSWPVIMNDLVPALLTDGKDARSFLTFADIGSTADNDTLSIPIQSIMQTAVDNRSDWSGIWMLWQSSSVGKELSFDAVVSGTEVAPFLTMTVQEKRKMPPITNQSYPLYANMNQGERPTELFTSADYDSLASLDVVGTMFDLFSPVQTNFDGFVDSVRTRNPDAIFLDYWWIWGASEAWETYPIGGLNRDFYDLINDNDFWMYDSQDPPERVRYTDTHWPLYLINIATPGAARMIGEFYADKVNSSSNAKPYTGGMLDFFDYNYFADWQCQSGDCGIIDINRNGVPYSAEKPVELALYQEAQKFFIEVIRENVNVENFIVIGNGSAWRSDEPAPTYDGGMQEKIHAYTPQTESEWRRACDDVYQPLMIKTAVDPQIVLYDMQGNAEENEKPLLAVSLATKGYAQISTSVAPPDDGRRQWYPIRPGGIGHRITLGKAIEGGYSWPNTAGVDTLYRQFELGFVRFEPLAGWPYEYVAVDTVSIPGVNDTLLISDNWPRKRPEQEIVEPSLVGANYYTATQIQQYPEPEFYAGHYDSIATMDIVQHHMMLFDEDESPAFIGYTDSLRARNPDMILLDYLYMWGAEDTWVGADSTYTAGNIRHDYWTFINDHNYWLHDIHGNRVEESSGIQAYLINVGFNKTRVDSFAQFFADYINASDNSREYTGVYLDYYAYPDYPNWPCMDPQGQCQQVIDLNENGTAYVNDVTNERAVYYRAMDDFAISLRSRINHDNFIIVSNGEAHHKSASYAAVTDGGKHERVRDFNPTTVAEWETNINETYPAFNTGVLVRPMILYDEPSLADGTEAKLVASALITNKTAAITHEHGSTRRLWTLEESTIGGRINLGEAIQGSNIFNPAVSDTAYRQYELGYIRFEPDVTGPTYWEHEFVIVDTVSIPGVNDTLLISDNWPRKGFNVPLEFTEFKINGGSEQ